MVNTALETMHRLDVRVVHIQHLSFSSAGSQRKPRMFTAHNYTRSDSGQLRVVNVFALHSSLRTVVNVVMV